MQGHRGMNWNDAQRRVYQATVPEMGLSVSPFPLRRRFLHVRPGCGSHRSQTRVDMQTLNGVWRTVAVSALRPHPHEKGE